MTKRIPDPWIDGLYDPKPPATRKRAPRPGSGWEYVKGESYCFKDRDNEWWIFTEGLFDGGWWCYGAAVPSGNDLRRFGTGYPKFEDYTEIIKTWDIRA